MEHYFISYTDNPTIYWLSLLYVLLYTIIILIDFSDEDY